jgi:uncharacterized membrane protein YhaH (DUF805 family)
MTSGELYSPLTIFGFRGRIGRRQFALSITYQVLMTLAVTAFPLAFGGARLAGTLADALAGDVTTLDLSGLVGPIIFTLAAQTGLSVLTFTSMRARLHDINMSAWWTIPMSLPSLAALAGALLYTGTNADVLQAIGIYVSVLFVVVLGLLPGTVGVNAYGPPPRGAAAVNGPQAG